MRLLPKALDRQFLKWRLRHLDSRCQAILEVPIIWRLQRGRQRKSRTKELSRCLPSDLRFGAKQERKRVRSLERKGRAEAAAKREAIADGLERIALAVDGSPYTHVAKWVYKKPKQAAPLLRELFEATTRKVPKRTRAGMGIVGF